MRLRVYIAGPISKGDLAHNVNQGTAAFVALAKAGLAPWCPHWSVYAKPCAWMHFGDGVRVECVATVEGSPDMTHADWMGIDLPWVAVAHAVLRLPGESAGADAEVRVAQEYGVPVFHSVADVVAWSKAKRGAEPTDPAVYVPTATAPAVGSVVVTEDDGDDVEADAPLLVEAGPLEWEPAGTRTTCGHYEVVWVGVAKFKGVYCKEPPLAVECGHIVSTPAAARAWCEADHRKRLETPPLEWASTDREHTRCGRYSILHRGGSWVGGYFPDGEVLPAAESPPVGTPEAAREWCQADNLTRQTHTPEPA